MFSNTPLQSPSLSPSPSPPQSPLLLLSSSLLTLQLPSPLPSRLHRCPAIHCAATVVAHHDCATAVAVSHCDNCCCPSSPPLLIAIARPSRRPLRCCHLRPPRLRCHRATLHHLLPHRHPSMCRLVVTWGWLSSLHLSLRHCLSSCRLVVTLPLDAPPSCLPQLVVASPHRRHCFSTRQLVVTSPLIAPPSCLSWLVVASPLIATPPLNALAGHALPLIVPP